MEEMTAPQIQTEKPLYTLLQQQNRNKPAIILDHNPTGIQEAVEQETALIVCGHTHKGQFLPAVFLQSWLMENRAFMDILGEEDAECGVFRGRIFSDAHEDWEQQ